MRMAKNANEYGDAVGRGIVSSHKCPTCDVRYENNDRDSRAHVTRCAKVDMTGIDLDRTAPTPPRSTHRTAPVRY